MEDLQKRIRDFLEDHLGDIKLKQKDLAAQLGIAETTLSSMMNGRGNFTLSQVHKIAEIFKVDAVAVIADRRLRKDYEAAFEAIESGRGKLLLKAIEYMELAEELLERSPRGVDRSPRGPGVKKKKRGAG